MELLYVLLVLLLATRVFGELAARFKQPVLVGELLAGVVLGILVKRFDEYFPILSELSDDRVFSAITDLGIFFLMLLAGVEMRPTDIVKASGPAFLVALGGMLLPMALGLGLGYVWLPESDYKTVQMLFLGVALSVTAVPITVATLLEIGQARSRIGVIIVSAAVFDDLFSLLLLAILTSVLKSGGPIEGGSVALLAGKVLLFLVVTALAGRYAFPLVGGFLRRLRIKHVEFSSLLAWALAFSVLAEWLGMHFVLGAYAAGLFFTKRTVDKDVHRDVHIEVEAITLGFFAPIFFASIGLHFHPSAILSVPVFLLALIVAAFLGKGLGAVVGGLLSGLDRRESMAVGIGMNARGAVELVVADIALRAGLFEYPEPPPPVVAELFSAVVIMAVVTSVVSPIGLRVVLNRR